ncbi:hypothetical protein [Endozoicomonas sp. YOMI1]|uniref:hypothetical protein n=1 Tax=Endozoicomonas sp. YOMI1 TaxID=2828739 RepID=UPI002147BB20|nr:hypothetical protein [Endozoicomonas sp. YOMI1]
MEVDLSYYLHCPALSLTEAAKIMSGIEPKDCLVSLESCYGPFRLKVTDQTCRTNLNKAKTFFDLLTEELLQPDSRLDIVNLFAIVRCSKNTLNNIAISDQPVSFDDCGKFDLLSVSPESLVKSDTAELFDVDGVRQLFCKKPSKNIREGLHKGNLIATGLTTVTTESLIQWVCLQGINSVFLRANGTENSGHHQQYDSLESLPEMIRIAPEYFSNEQRIQLEAQLYLCRNGSSGRVTKQVIVKYLKDQHNIAPGSNESERIAMLIHPIESPAGEKRGAGIIMPSFKEYLTSKTGE